MGVKGTNCGGINLKHPMILMPSYSARLSSGEAVTVRADVERGKGRKDRHISPRTVQSIFERARNSFAAYLLGSGGVDLRYTEELPGHKDSKTTEIYTHVGMKDLRRIRSPLDMMVKGEKDG